MEIIQKKNKKISKYKLLIYSYNSVYNFLYSYFFLSEIYFYFPLGV